MSCEQYKERSQRWWASHVRDVLSKHFACSTCSTCQRLQTHEDEMTQQVTSYMWEDCFLFLKKRNSNKPDHLVHTLSTPRSSPSTLFLFHTISAQFHVTEGLKFGILSTHVLNLSSPSSEIFSSNSSLLPFWSEQRTLVVFSPIMRIICYSFCPPVFTYMWFIVF